MQRMGHPRQCPCLSRSNSRHSRGLLVCFVHTKQDVKPIKGARVISGEERAAPNVLHFLDFRRRGRYIAPALVA